MIKQSFRKILKSMSQHKFIAGIVIIFLIFAFYSGYKAIFKKSGVTTYVLGQVEKGTLIVSVSGSGQVSATNQIDVKPKASGDVIYVAAKKGQQVKAGALLVQLDSSDAQKTVRDAEINLEKATMNLEQIQGVTTEEGTIRSNKEKAQDDLQKAYDDGFNTVANTFLDLPDIITGLNSILFSYNFEANQQNIDYYANTVVGYDTTVSQYRDDAYAKYLAARKSYDKNFLDYKSASRYSENSIISNLINETYETAKDAAEAVKSATNLIQFYQDRLTQRGFRVQSLSDTHLSSLSSYTSKTNNFLVNLLSAKNTIQSDKEAIITSDFDLTSQKIQVEQAQNTLSDAKEKLTNYYVRAPFDGVVTTMDIKKGDAVNSSTIITTLITQQKIAEISLNEVDVSSVKVGQKVTLTFDAIPDLSISGEVADIDSLGTVSQGVVSYVVKIAFDTQDDRAKPSMTVSASIITNVKQNVLMVPNSAIKTQNNTSYVQIPDASEANTTSTTGVVLNKTIQQQQIQVGISNDESAEIISGLKEGDKIIVRTVQAGSTTTQSSSSIRLPGVGGGFRGD